MKIKAKLVKNSPINSIDVKWFDNFGQEFTYPFFVIGSKSSAKEKIFINTYRDDQETK